MQPADAAYARLGMRVSGLVFHQVRGTLTDAQFKAAFAASQHIARNAQLLGFENGFVLAGIILLAGLPLCLLLTNKRTAALRLA
jgi:hypothetical protein